MDLDAVPLSERVVVLRDILWGDLNVQSADHHKAHVGCSPSAGRISTPVPRSSTRRGRRNLPRISLKGKLAFLTGSEEPQTAHSSQTHTTTCAQLHSSSLLPTGAHSKGKHALRDPPSTPRIPPAQGNQPGQKARVSLLFPSSALARPR